MKKLIIIRGASGVGKTTVAEKLANELKIKKLARVPVDITPSRLVVNPYSINRDEMAKLTQDNSESLVKNFLSEGYTIIIDGMFYRKHKGRNSLKRLLDIGKKNKAKTYVIELDADKEDVLERINQRSKTDKKSDNDAKRVLDRYERFSKTRYKESLVIDTKGKNVDKIIKEILREVRWKTTIIQPKQNTTMF